METGIEDRGGEEPLAMSSSMNGMGASAVGKSPMVPGREFTVLCGYMEL